MLTRPQGILGTREFGLSWLKRARRRPEGDKPVGSSGVPIAETRTAVRNRPRERDEEPMSGAPEKDIVKATKEESVITEAARVVGSHQGRAFDVNARKTDAPLETIKCTIQFGGLVAVNALDMSVRRGEIYGLIGPNGAGKTTVFNLLTGVYKPTSGEIYFQGKRINGLRSYEISRRACRALFKTSGFSPACRCWKM